MLEIVFWGFAFVATYLGATGLFSRLVGFLCRVYSKGVAYEALGHSSMGKTLDRLYISKIPHTR